MQGASNETIYALLNRLERKHDDLARLLVDQRAEFVAVAVWAQRNAHVDNRLGNLEKDVEEIRQDARGAVGDLRKDLAGLSADLRAAVKDLRAEASSRRPQWTAVGSLVIAGTSLLIVLIQSMGGAP